MKIYIQAAAAISPQQTFGQETFLEEPVTYTGNRLQTVDPDYTKLIDPKSLRRMSRVIKMGVATALACLQDAGETNPGAIITGTAFGCMEDSDFFLKQIIERKEDAPPPTPFIQSTHNTVGAQIALILKCHHYNNTFAHGGTAFENALLDAILLLKDGEAKNVLVGGIDEITESSYAIMSRFGFYKKENASNLDLYKNNSKGTIAGEGAAFFLLSAKNENAIAQLDGISSFYRPKDTKEIEQQISSFLDANAVATADIDLIISGKNGDNREDGIYEQLQQSVFKNKTLLHYKNLCGEYPTATSFALWMAVNILKTGIVPEAAGYDGSNERKLRRILIYNQYRKTHHSLILISAC
ncbi:MAG: 3-oxoacyl-(acyl carrier protein) synthase [Sediminibacterium sp.]|nr:3-oxoacyl-(acyl carrier protein) synthase [Sediminibacterium sp.]